MEMNVGKIKVKKISREPSTVQIMIDQKQLENVEYLNYLVSMVTNDVRCTREIKARIAIAKLTFGRKKTIFICYFYYY
jgi:hypothetical protein